MCAIFCIRAGLPAGLWSILVCGPRFIDRGAPKSQSKSQKVRKINCSRINVWGPKIAYRSARPRSNWANSASSNVGCIKRVNKYCDWFGFAADDIDCCCCCCCNADITLLAVLKPIMPLLEPLPDEFAAAAAANNIGFDVMVISRPELVADDVCWCATVAFDAFDEPIVDEPLFTGCGRRGNRSSCCRAAWNIYAWGMRVK